MKEVFKVGYTNYLEKTKKSMKKNQWTSRTRNFIGKHKIMISIFVIILICFIINFWLICKFINILEINRVSGNFNHITEMLQALSSYS